MASVDIENFQIGEDRRVRDAHQCMVDIRKSQLGERCKRELSCVDRETELVQFHPLPSVLRQKEGTVRVLNPTVSVRNEDEEGQGRIARPSHALLEELRYNSI